MQAENEIQAVGVSALAGGLEHVPKLHTLQLVRWCASGAGEMMRKKVTGGADQRDLLMGVM